MEDTLHDYIRKAAAQGVPVGAIQDSLRVAGWDETLIAQGLHDVLSVQQLNRTRPPENQTQSLPASQPKNYVRSVYTSSQPFYRTHLILSIVFFLIFGASTVGGALYYYRYIPDSEKVSETDAINQQITQSKGILYTNTEFRFTVSLPEGWGVKEYPPDTFAPERRISFGPHDTLPNEFMSDDTSVWIRIFGTENATLYSEFQRLTSQIGKDSKIRSMNLGGKQGYLASGVVAAEYSGFVYELHLLTSKPTTAESSLTQDSTLILESFRFLE